MSRPTTPGVAAPGAPAAARDRLLAAHADAARFYRDRLAGCLRAWRYLAGRGLAGVAGQQRWGLGWAPPSWGALVGHLRGLGYDEQELVAAGLALRGRRGRLLDRFRDRVMVPLRDAQGSVVGFTGRDLGGSPGAPKYLNSPATALFCKAAVLHGWAEQRAELGHPRTRRLVVEGPLDVLAVAAAHAGSPGPTTVAVATCGTALSAQHAALLAAGDGAQLPLVLAFDPDRAGRAATERAHRVLASWPGGVHALDLPADPAALLRERGPTGARAALAAGGQPLLDAVIEHRLRRHDDQVGTGWVETRVAALRSVAPLIASDPRPAELGRRSAALARRLDLHPATVATAVLEAFDAAHAAPGGARPARPAGAPDRTADGRSTSS